MEQPLILFAVVFAVNLMPAFGPPTWSIIVLYGLNTDVPLAATVAIGAFAAACGRFILAWSFRLLGARAPSRIRRNLDAAREVFQRRRSAGFAALGLFALSPVPSAQLFEAAGLTKVPLFPFTAAFFAGRLVSYSIYALGARTLRNQALGDVIVEQLTSPLGIALQLAMIAAVIALAWIDWQKVFRGREAPPGGKPNRSDPADGDS